MSSLSDWGQLLQGIGTLALAFVTLTVGILAAVSGIKITFQNRLQVTAQPRQLKGRKSFLGVELDTGPQPPPKR